MKRAAAVSCLLFIGCSSSPSVSAVARANPDNVVTALVDVTTRHATSVQIDYGDTDAYGQSTPNLAVEDGTHTFAVVGLTPSATSHMRVTASSTHGSARTGDLTVAIDPLPDILPTFSVSPPNAPVSGYLLLGIIRLQDMAGYGLIVDRSGRILWYRKSGGSTRGLQFDRLANGHYVLYQLTTTSFEEIDLVGNLLHVWQSVSAKMGADGHDFRLLPDNHALVLGDNVDMIDTRPYFDGGVANANLFDTVVEEITPDGGVAFHWSSFPEITPAELGPPIAGIPIDPTNVAIRPNTLTTAPDGNFIVSLVTNSTLLKLDRASGAILWRLGGNRNDFKFVNDPFGGPSQAHDFGFLPNGNLLLFDNGGAHAPMVGRVVEYQIDEQSKTATQVWQYRHSPDLFSPVAGSARRLSNGNTVVTFAVPGTVTEVDASANAVWEMQMSKANPQSSLQSNFIIYRLIPIDSPY